MATPPQPAPTPETNHAAFRSRYADHVPTEVAKVIERSRDELAARLAEAQAHNEKLMMLATPAENAYQLIARWKERAEQDKAALVKMTADRDMWLADNVKQNDSVGLLVFKLERSEAALKAAREDAERYRWLRKHSWIDISLIKSVLNFGLGYDQTKPEILDAAIDAARARQGREG